MEGSGRATGMIVKLLHELRCALRMTSSCATHKDTTLSAPRSTKGTTISREAVATLEDVERIARRVLGSGSAYGREP